MEQNNQSSYNVVTTSKPGKSSKQGLIIGSLVVVFLAIAVAAGVILVRQQQDIREKAEAALGCPSAEACPVAGDATLLNSCNTVTNGEAPQSVSCSTIANVGTIALCGTHDFCCPSLGASWTPDLTLCASPSPTASPTVEPTATATAMAEATASASPTATATATATATGSPTPTGGATASPSPSNTALATASPTAVPIPVTGTNWPTIVGAAVGILVIIGSILLVL